MLATIRHARRQMPNILRVIVALYFFSFIFEGLVRYVLSKVGLSTLLYARDLVPLLAIGSIITLWRLDHLRPSTFLIFIGILLLHLLTGTFYLHGPMQQLFGFKIFLPMILGMALASHSGFIDGNRTFLPQLLIIFVASLTGLIINDYFTYPWEGELFESAFATNEQSRVWSADGVRRLSGLSRVSFDAASVILLSTILIWSYILESKLRFIIFIFAAYGITLTTTKGALFGLLVFGISAQFSAAGKRLNWLKFVLMIVIIVMTLLPIISQIHSVSQRSLPSYLFWWLSSFIERMEWTWPRALNLWLNHGSLLVGRGLGGIGVPQNYGEWWLSSPADNLFVFLTVTFGFLGSIYLGLFVNKAIGWNGSTAQENIAMLGILIGLVTFGFTANIIEQPLLSCALGYCVICLFRPRTV